MRICAMTDVGCVRPNNQDSFEYAVTENPGQAIFVVCDGMGGAKAGDIASSLAVKIFIENLSKYIKPSMSARYRESILQNAVRFANFEVYQKSNMIEEFYGMGTTLVGGVLHESAVTLVNIGDSRAYLIGPDGVESRTRDHSFVEEMLRRGDISEDEAKIHPRRNMITRVLGTDEKIVPDLYSFPLLEERTLLLCSDGLSNLIGDAELCEIVNGCDDVDLCCEKLIGEAKDRGGYDNITVLLLRV